MPFKDEVSNFCATRITPKKHIKTMTGFPKTTPVLHCSDKQIKYYPRLTPVLSPNSRHCCSWLCTL